jgi:hypothetical protein
MKSLVLKGFDVIFEKSLVGKWCDLLIIHR